MGKNSLIKELFVKGRQKLKRFALRPDRITCIIILFAAVITYKYLFGTEGISAFFSKTADILRPFIWGFAIAYILNIPAKAISGLLQKYTFIKNKPHTAAVAVTYILLFALIALASAALFPPLRQSTAELIKNAPEYYVKTREFLRKYSDVGFINYLSALIPENGGYFSFSDIGTYAKNIIGFTGSIFDIFIAVIVSVYTLAFNRKLLKHIGKTARTVMPENIFEFSEKCVCIINEVFSKYIISQAADAVVVAALACIIMGIMKIRYALVLGIIIGIFNMIPYIGAFTSVSVALLLTFITDGAVKTVWLAVFLIALQQADANFISVKIVGRKLSLNPLEVIFAIAAGGGYFGIAGMFFALPVFASAKEICSELLSGQNKNSS